MSKIACFLLGLTAAAVVPAALSETLRHPHFQKKLEVRLPKTGGGTAVVSVSHLTATFDKKGFSEMKTGGAWHLANAHLETDTPLEIGGKTVPAGKYRIVARKTETSWELVLDQPGKFDAKLGDTATALATTFNSDAPVEGHLRLDLHPTGAGEKAGVELSVAFDVHRATVRVAAGK